MSTQVAELLRQELQDRQVTEEAERLSGPGSFIRFVKAAWPVIKSEVSYSHNWHIDAIGEHLEAVTAGEIKRLQVWVPPVSMKSLLVSVLWPAWEWTFRPGIRYWGASYETRLAMRLSAMSRDLVLTDWYQQRWGENFQVIRDAEHYWGNNRGGTRLATSPESTGTGEHGDRILIDDPLSAQKADAISRTNLNFVNEVWYDGTVATRGTNPEHARIIIMQRLHENDLAAHVLTLEDWTVLALPERFWPTHPYAWRGSRTDIESEGSTIGSGDPRMVEGDLLWPEQRPAAVSDAIANSLKHRAAGQQQQWPAPKEGQILKRHWWRFYDPEIMLDAKRRPHCSAVVQTIDTPLKDKESNDMVSIQSWGVRGADRYLLDIRTEHMNYLQAKRAIKEQALYVRRMFPRVAHYILIENAGYGVELIIDLKRELTGVTKISPTQDGDKVMRAEAASSDLESGNCWLPGVGGGADETLGPVRKAAAVITKFIESCALFPLAEHDDDVDAWSQCMNFLRARSVRPARTASPFLGRGR